MYLSLHQEPWNCMKWWYRVAVACTPPPARVTLERITAERVDLYRRIPPTGENIPVYVDPYPVEDLVSTENEIEWEVKRLRNKCSGGNSGMQDEKIKGWLVESQKEEATEAKKSVTEGTT